MTEDIKNHTPSEEKMAENSAASSEVKDIKKYTLSKDDTKQVYCKLRGGEVTVYKVIYNEDYRYAKAMSRNKGGYIENESCLSQSGRAVITNGIILLDGVSVQGDAAIEHHRHNDGNVEMIDVVISVGHPNYLAVSRLQVRHSAVLRIGAKTCEKGREYASIHFSHMLNSILQSAWVTIITEDGNMTIEGLRATDNANIWIKTPIVRCGMICVADNARLKYDSENPLNFKGVLEIYEKAQVIMTQDKVHTPIIDIPHSTYTRIREYDYVFDTIKFTGSTEMPFRKSTITFINKYSTGRIYAYNIHTGRWRIGCTTFNSSKDLLELLDAMGTEWQKLEYTTAIKQAEEYMVHHNKYIKQVEETNKKKKQRQEK